MPVTSVSHAIAFALKRYGFELVQTGGGCSAFIRDDGQIEEVITVATGPKAPEHLTDDVVVSTREHDGDPDESPESGHTLADVLAALRNPSDEYALLSLRLYNGFHKPENGGVAETPVATRYQTRAVLAGAYRQNSPSAFLTHSVDTANGDAPLCKRVKAESVADEHADDVNARPTCSTCLRRDPRFAAEA